MRKYSDKDEALSVIILEAKHLSQMFEHIQNWTDGDEEEIDSLLSDPERQEDIYRYLDNINDALEMLEI